MDQDAVTFGLAAIGYVLLAKDTALRLCGRRWAWLGASTAIVVLTHVAMVWALRFEWSLSYAWEKSAGAFLLFHFALALIALAPLLGGVARDRVTQSAFCIVSLGVLPAPFRYPEISMLALPMIAAFVGVVVVFFAARIRAKT